jgi:hypothetical protein
MRRFYYLLFLASSCLFSQTESCQVFICDTFSYQEVHYKDSMGYYEHLFDEMHTVETDDRKLKLAYFVALSHYPELWRSPIKLTLKAIPSTMQAQPKWNFLFLPRRYRSYQIFVNSHADVTGITYQDLNFNSLVGWIGHEMAHLAEYKEKSNMQLVRFVASYVLNKNHLRKTEHQADRTTIQHGLGVQLLEGVNFFHRNRKVNNSYREKNKKYYLSPEEIVLDINQLCLK